MYRMLNLFLRAYKLIKNKNNNTENITIDIFIRRKLFENFETNERAFQMFNANTSNYLDSTYWTCENHTGNS
jgi:hypothetical protein